MPSRDLLFRSLLSPVDFWLLPDVAATAFSEDAVSEAALSAAEAEEAAVLVEEVFPVLLPQAAKSMDMPRAAAVMAANCFFIFIQNSSLVSFSKIFFCVPDYYRAALKRQIPWED
jgi:hypothetical protein